MSTSMIEVDPGVMHPRFFWIKCSNKFFVEKSPTLPSIAISSCTAFISLVLYSSNVFKPFMALTIYGIPFNLFKYDPENCILALVNAKPIPDEC